VPTRRQSRLSGSVPLRRCLRLQPLDSVQDPVPDPPQLIGAGGLNFRRVQF